MARFWRTGLWRVPRSRILFCHGPTTLHELDPCKGLRFATTARLLILPTRYSVRTAEQNSARSPPAPNPFSSKIQKLEAGWLQGETCPSLNAHGRIGRVRRRELT